jgi:hypothetical protein
MKRIKAYNHQEFHSAEPLRGSGDCYFLEQGGLRSWFLQAAHMLLVDKLPVSVLMKCIVAAVGHNRLARCVEYMLARIQ